MLVIRSETDIIARYFIDNFPGGIYGARRVNIIRKQVCMTCVRLHVGVCVCLRVVWEDVCVSVRFGS